jgi:arsenite-transporting ATPase
VLLFTGKGGVGKTTTAAATAALAARQGLKTLVLSTDSAHSLADALEVAAGPEPTECQAGLFVQQVDAEARLNQSWSAIQTYLREALEATGLERLQAEELTGLPGAEEVLALLEVKDQVRSGRWNLVVVDCAPTAETLRLLALPEALDWYLSKLYPVERRVARALRPVLGTAVGLPLPRQPVLEAAEALHQALLDVQSVLRAPTTSVRLVLTPESVVVAEARRTLTSLALYGFQVDAVVANRVFGNSSDPWLARWAAAQQAQLAEVVDSFSPLPVFQVEYAAAEPVGVAALEALAEACYGQRQPFAVSEPARLLVVDRTGDGYTMQVTLPLADRSQLDLARVGDDLVIGVGGRRRILSLPSALRRCSVAGAHLDNEELQISFVPDRRQWPDSKGAHP